MENEHGKEADGTAIDSSRQALLFQCVQGVSQMHTIPRADGRTRTKLSHQPLHNSPSACTLAGEQQLLVAAHLCRERSQHGAGAAGIRCQPRGFARALCLAGRWWLQEMLPRETGMGAPMLDERGLSTPVCRDRGQGREGRSSVVLLSSCTALMSGRAGKLHLA